MLISLFSPFWSQKKRKCREHLKRQKDDFSVEVDEKVPAHKLAENDYLEAIEG